MRANNKNLHSKSEDGMIPYSLIGNWKLYGHYDVAVIGAGPSGFGAAVAAARRGLRTVLIENYGFAGGVAPKSCVSLFFNLAIGGKQITGGLPDEVVRRLDAMGEASFTYRDECAIPEYAPVGDRPLTSKIAFRPETIKLLYRRMLEEAGVECLFYTRVCDVFTDGGDIRALLVSLLEGTKLITADTYIDCTGDALVCALADTESVRKYDDEYTMHKSMFFFVDGVTPFNHEYNCDLYSRLFREGKVPGSVWSHFGYALQLDPGICQIAVCYETGDGVNSADMTRMDFSLRENVYKIMDFLHGYMPGFENCRLIQTSAHVGVRGGQGIVGIDSVTDETVFGGNRHDIIAQLNCSIGAHQNRKTAQFNSAWSRHENGTGSLPMGALIPGKIGNALCAGRAVSSEPHLIGTFRMMPTCMSGGEAAGLIAYLAADTGKRIREITYGELRPLLDENGFILD